MVFQVMDGPNSGIRPADSYTVTGDTVTFHNLLAGNGSDHTIPIGVWLPYVYVAFPVDPNNLLSPPDHTEALTWNTAMHGWYTPDFIDAAGVDTHESLLVTAKFITNPERPDIPLRAGNVAKIDDPTAQYPLHSSAFLGPPSFPLGLYPDEEIHPNDLLPFTSLGAIGAHQSKSFDLAFTAHWGGVDRGAVDTNGWITTLEPNHSNGIFHEGGATLNT